MIGASTMKTIVKQDGKITITITYKNEPSQTAIQNFANKLKNTIDIKVHAS